MNDCLFLNNYRKTIEIGAFREEHHSTQDVAFSITLALKAASGADDSAVDDILSYDVLVDAVEDNLAARRYNLLEVLAEDIARDLLKAPQVYSVDVEITKLDRVDGQLGVRIRRIADHGETALTIRTPDREDAAHRLIVVYGEAMPPLDAPAVVMFLRRTGRLDDEIAQRQSLLEMDARSWGFSRNLGLPVVDTKTEAEALLGRQESFILGFGKQVFAMRPRIEVLDDAKLIEWAKAQIKPSAVEIMGDQKDA